MQQQENPSFYSPSEPVQTLRWNNPGNIRMGLSAELFGGKLPPGVEPSRTNIRKFAMFSDAVEGAAAMMHLLSQRYTGHTVSSAVAKWEKDHDFTRSISLLFGSGSAIDGDILISKSKLRSDPKWAIRLCVAISRSYFEEEGRPYPLEQEHWIAAHRAFTEELEEETVFKSAMRTAARAWISVTTFLTSAIVMLIGAAESAATFLTEMANSFFSMSGVQKFLSGLALNSEVVLGLLAILSSGLALRKFLRNGR